MRTCVGLALAALVLSACGSTTTTVTRVTVTATTPAKPQLPYDAEENAFMGQFSWTGGHDTSTGCLAMIDSQTVCDCTYRALRAQGYPASELAAIGSGISIENNLPANVPAWLGHQEAVCETGT